MRSTVKFAVVGSILLSTVAEAGGTGRQKRNRQHGQDKKILRAAEPFEQYPQKQKQKPINLEALENELLDRLNALIDSTMAIQQSDLYATQVVQNIPEFWDKSMRSPQERGCITKSAHKG